MEFFANQCFCNLQIIYCKNYSKVYLVGVSDENVFKICSFSESEKERLLEWRVPDLQLKGIKSLIIVHNRYLTIETVSKLVCYNVWDIVEPINEQPPRLETLLDQTYSDYSCLQLPTFSFEQKTYHPNAFLFAYGEVVQMFIINRN